MQIIEHMWAHAIRDGSMAVDLVLFEIILDGRRSLGIGIGWSLEE